MKHTVFLLLFTALLAGCARQLPYVELMSPLRDGYGEVMLPDGGYYRGEFRNGLLDGEGVLTWSNGMYYEGHFRKGIQRGNGVFHYPSGEVYSGQFVNGLASGHGEYIAVNGDRYIGEFIDDVPGGEMVVNYANGDRYEGGMLGWDIYHGHGVDTLVNGDRYEGEFKEGVSVGRFNVRISDGSRYEGALKEWLFHGEGEWWGGDGSHYRGMFSRGMFDGKGDFTTSEGSRYLGEFKNGNFHGDGELLYRHGDVVPVTMKGRWRLGRYIEDDADKYVATGLVNLDAGTLLYQQPQQVSAKLARLIEHTPGEPDLYFVAFGSHGGQDVFMKEVQHATEVMTRLYGVAEQSVSLINNLSTLDETPLATVMNLQEMLKGIAAKMDVDEDILFLYVTSHGSREHVIDVSLGGIPLRGVTPATLRTALDEAGFKWRVVMISTCFSGGFIEPLKGMQTLVMTAARADLASFGCGDDSDLTYFGRAFFEHALRPGISFVEAFEVAREWVEEVETNEGLSHSEPQIASSPAIEQKLARWLSIQGVAQ